MELGGIYPVHRRQIRWIVVLILSGLVLGGTAGLIQALFSPSLFFAEATIGIYQSKYRWSQQVGVLTIRESIDTVRNVARSIAKDDRTVEKVLEKMGDSLSEQMRSVDALRKQLSVTQGGGIYLHLRTKATDAQLAARLAEVWAQVVEEEIERLFYEDMEDVSAFRELLTAAGKRLDQATTALETFAAQHDMLPYQMRQGSREEDTVQSLPALELAQINETLALYRFAQNTLKRLVEEVERARGSDQKVNWSLFAVLDDLELLNRRGTATRDKLQQASGNLARVQSRLEQEAQALQPVIDLLADDARRIRSDLSLSTARLRELTRQELIAQDVCTALEKKLWALEAETELAQRCVEIVSLERPEEAGAIQAIVQTAASAVLGGFLGFSVAMTWLYLRRRTGALTGAAG